MISNKQPLLFVFVSMFTYFKFTCCIPNFPIPYLAKPFSVQSLTKNTQKPLQFPWRDRHSRSWVPPSGQALFSSTPITKPQIAHQVQMRMHRKQTKVVGEVRERCGLPSNKKSKRTQTQRSSYFIVSIDLMP